MAKKATYKNRNLEVNRFIKFSLTRSNKTLRSPLFALLQCIDTYKKKGVKSNCTDKSIYWFRKDNIHQIISKLESSSQQENQNIINQSVTYITGQKQWTGQDKILWIKKPVKLTVNKTYKHVNQSIYTQYRAKKYITKKPRKKSHEQSFSVAVHKAESAGDYNQEIGADVTDCKIFKYGGL